MSMLKKIFSVFFAAIWISISEFVRNEFLFKSLWVEHYQKLGWVFPSEPINGMMWGVWSILFAISIFIIIRKFSLIQSCFLAWLMAFVMMWIAIGNLGVLPLGLLIFAIPLSILETFIACFIIKKIAFGEK